MKPCIVDTDQTLEMEHMINLYNFCSKNGHFCKQEEKENQFLNLELSMSETTGLNAMFSYTQSLISNIVTY